MLAAGAPWALPAESQPASCQRTDFEAVVGDAASALRDLTQTNTPVFQNKLRQLKDKRGWSHSQFLIEAAPLVQDDQITEYDQESGDLLNRINTMGQEGSEKAPDCTLLAELRGHMQALVDAQKAKWAYMFDKIDTELAR